jgi:hypothetical protein
MRGFGGLRAFCYLQTLLTGDNETGRNPARFHTRGPLVVIYFFQNMRLLIVFLFSVLFIEVSAQTENKKLIYEELGSVEQVRIDSIIFSKIPYDSVQAHHDIKSGKIKIIVDACGGDPMNTNEEVDYVENKFGFEFAYDCLQLPREHVLQRQSEYNEVVYRYLDSLNNIDCEKAIYDELFRLLIERELTSKRTDKELQKIVRKSLKGESKEIKKQVYQADLLYRDRKFQEALKIYRDIKTEKNKSSSYLINSQYHCLMNLNETEKARSLYLNNKTSVNRKKK